MFHFLCCVKETGSLTYIGLFSAMGTGIFPNEEFLCTFTFSLASGKITIHTKFSTLKLKCVVCRFSHSKSEGGVG